MSNAIISLIIVAICIVLFLTRIIPTAATAVLGCLLFVLTGVCSVKDAFSGFSNSTVILVFCMMVVGIAMEETGAAAIVGRKVAQVSRHNERLFILVAGLTAALLSTFLSNTSVNAIFLPLIAGICVSEENMNRMNLTLPIAMATMFGGTSTLVGSTPQLTGNGILEGMCDGKLVGMFDYTLPGVCLLVILLVYTTLIGPHLAKRIWGGRPEEVVTVGLGAKTSGEEVRIKENEAEAAVLDSKAIKAAKEKKRKLIYIVTIFALTIVSYLLTSIESIKWIDISATAVAAALLCVITGTCSVKSVYKHIDWNVVFVLAGCLGIASGISKGGAGELMAQVIANVLGDDVPALVIFAVFVLATMIISNFITNSTAVTIVLPIALAFCMACNLNPIAFTIGVVFAANLSFCTPLANAQMAMALVAGYRFSDYIRYTWPLALMSYAGILVFVPLFYPLVL